MEGWGTVHCFLEKLANFEGFSKVTVKQKSLKQHYTKDDIAQAVKVDVQTLYLKRIYFSSFAYFKKPGTSLVVQWLRLCFYCRGCLFEPRSGK